MTTQFKPGPDHPAWKDKPGYRAIHQWVQRRRGKAAAHACVTADETCRGRIEWANLSRNYRRDPADYIPLCTSHHRRLDLARSRP
jgi:hypothetical protein